jgi:signal transduction histidine kinase
MIQKLRNAPIRIKLVAIILLVTAIVLFIGAVQFLVFEYFNYRNNTTERLYAVADIVAINSASALVFEDQLAALESLSTLQVERSILTASIIDERGMVFANYLNSQLYESDENSPLQDSQRDHLEKIMDPAGWLQFSWDQIDVARPILVEDEMVGAVYITASTQAMFAGMRRFLTVMLLVTVMSFSVVVLLSTRLQRFITVPIGKLLETMSKVSDEENYTLHVEKTNEDELGQLIERFNSMLGAVRQRDELLKKHKANLESVVKARTEEVVKANMNLKNTFLDLRKAKETAEAANVAKSTFLTSMSHELRTPLNAVIGFSEVLIDGHFGPVNEQQKEYLGDILASGQHLLALITDILDIAKIEAGRDELELGIVNIPDLIDHSLIMIREKAHKHGITVDYKVEADIEDMEINADLRKLKQVLFNLLSNAAKFTPDNGRIEVSVHRADGEIFISVEDTGSGIEEKELEKIFEEFYQTQGGLVSKTPGTGLGLALARKYVERHGGRIWAESQGRGKGSRFTFTVRTDLVEMHDESYALSKA